MLLLILYTIYDSDIVLRNYIQQTKKCIYFEIYSPTIKKNIISYYGRPQHGLNIIPTSAGPGNPYIMYSTGFSLIRSLPIVLSQDINRIIL